MEWAQDLLSFIDDTPTPYQVTEEALHRLTAAGYRIWDVRESETFSPGEKIAVKIGDSAFFAFHLGEKPPWESGFSLIGVHTDSPGFQLKPRSPKISEGTVVLNTGVYGAPIFHTWVDRPLSIAGRVILRKAGHPVSQNLNLKDPVALIPSLALHMDRKVNENKSWRAQKDLLPVIALDEKFSLGEMLEEAAGGELLDGDLFLYPVEKSRFVGGDRSLISAPRLDDTAMVHAGLTGLLQRKDGETTAGIMALNHEEVGSRTAQGAVSALGAQILERIVTGLGGTRDQYLQSLFRSFFISADMAHGVHPLYPEKSDPTNRPWLGYGPVIKVSPRRSYVTDGKSMALFQDWCDKLSVPVQTFTNHSDTPGGSTIGPLTMGHMPMAGIDVGSAIWGMHSAMETGSRRDHESIVRVFSYFLSK